jgi:DNA-binding NarL/FixJ family response regulator
MGMPSITIALVEDHILFRRMLINYFSRDERMNILLQSSDLQVVASELDLSSVDVLVLDLFLPRLINFDDLRIIRTKFPQLKILVLSMCTDLKILSEVLELGVHGCISKVDEPEELARAIWSISENKIYRNKLFTEVLYQKNQNTLLYSKNGLKNILSDREKKVLQLIWEEKSNREIAEEICLGIRSAEKIRQDIKDKLQIKSTIGILKYGINNNIIRLHD